MLLCENFLSSRHGKVNLCCNISTLWPDPELFSSLLEHMFFSLKGDAPKHLFNSKWNWLESLLKIMLIECQNLDQMPNLIPLSAWLNIIVVQFTVVSFLIVYTCLISKIYPKTILKTSSTLVGKKQKEPYLF